MSDRPGFAVADRAGRQRDDRPGVRRKLALRAPALDLLAPAPSIRAAAIPPAAPRPSAAPARPSGRSCAAACARPQRTSLSRPKRISPTKPVRSGMPARKGASAAFHLRDMIKRLAVTRRAQLRRRAALEREAEPPARQIGDDRLAQARHVVGERRAQRTRDHVDRALGRLARATA